MRQTVLFAGIVCLLLSSGCLGLVSNEEIQTKLVVDVDQSTQLIETSYEQGEMISSSTATFTFDFSQTASDVSVRTYGVDIDDGRSFAIDAGEQQTISLDIERHGMYIVTAYAIDSQDIRVQELHTLVVEQVTLGQKKTRETLNPCFLKPIQETMALILPISFSIQRSATLLLSMKSMDKMLTWNGQCLTSTVNAWAIEK